MKLITANANNCTVPADGHLNYNIQLDLELSFWNLRSSRLSFGVIVAKS